MTLARTVVRTMSRISSPLVETLFPCTCWATGVAITRDDLGLSPAVREEIARGVAWPYCTRCGATIGHYADHSKANPCTRCAVRNLGVYTIARAGTFDAPLATLVKQLKFNNRPEIAPVLAPFLYQAITLRGLPVDALVPVPLHWRRRIQRGYNQSDELARAVSTISGWPLHNVLRRIRRTPEQSHAQSVPQRIENLRGAFMCRAGLSFAGKHIWLIDDVCTTGATVHAAAMAFRALPKADRPSSINAGVVCVTDWLEVPKNDPS